MSAEYHLPLDTVSAICWSICIEHRPTRWHFSNAWPHKRRISPRSNNQTTLSKRKRYLTSLQNRIRSFQVKTFSESLPNWKATSGFLNRAPLSQSPWIHQVWLWSQPKDLVDPWTLEQHVDTTWSSNLFRQSSIYVASCKVWNDAWITGKTLDSLWFIEKRAWLALQLTTKEEIINVGTIRDYL
jgi:hypothetical protein